MTKKATKIYSTDTENLSAAIAEAEGRATARTMNIDWLQNTLYRVMHIYLNDLPKKYAVGCKATVHASTEKLAKSYTYRAESTQAHFEHDGKGWVLVSVERATLRQAPSKEGVELELTDAAKEWLLDSLRWI